MTSLRLLIIHCSPTVAGLNPTSGLLGHTLEDAAHIDQWVHLADSEVNANTDIIDDLIEGQFSPYNKSVRQVHMFT